MIILNRGHAIDFEKKKVVEAKKKRSKYKAKAVIDEDGIRHASKKQARRWEDLKILLKAGEINNLKREVTIPLVVNGIKVCSYRADHVYSLKNGEMVVEDVKGFKGGLAYSFFKIKAKLVKAVHGIEVQEI